MRDAIDPSDDRPSRLSRLAVLVATVGVAVITVWVFVPILLANYTATPVAAPKARAIARDPGAPVAVATASTRSVVPLPPARAAAPVPAAPATIRAATDTDPVPRWEDRKSVV